MTAPEPTPAEGLAEKVARTRHAMTFQAKFGWPAWNEAPARYRSEAVRHAEEQLAAMEAAGLAVVELPKPVPLEERINGTGIPVAVPAPGWDVTGCYFPGSDESTVELHDLFWLNLDRAERDALRLLSAVAAVRQLRADHDSTQDSTTATEAEHHGGDPR